MRQLLPILIAGLSVSSLHAQLDPLAQIFNKAFIPTLVEYDSITASADSGIAFVPYSAAHQHYFFNGAIDTLTIYQNNVPTVAYFGKQTGNRTEIKGVDISSGNNDSIEMVVVVKDQMVRDSVIEYYQYMGSFIKAFDVEYTYNGFGKVSQLDIVVPQFGSFAWDMFYDNQQRLDSIYYQISPAGSGPGAVLYFYNASIPGRLERVELYEDLDNDGELDLFQLLECKNNAQNNVYEIVELIYSTSSQTLELNGVLRFGIRKNSTISLKEYADALKLEAYPNPVKDLLFLDGIENGSDYRIYSMDGIMLTKGIMFNSRIDFSQLPAGMYLIEVQSDGKMYQGRILKDRN